MQKQEPEAPQADSPAGGASSFSPLPILYHDEYMVAINKPSGLLVHRTHISSDQVFAMQTLRDQIGTFLYPVHRLDRPTSGVLVFGLDRGSARVLSRQFSEGAVLKRYLALVRGWTEESGLIDHSVRAQGEKKGKPARTQYQRLWTTEQAWPCGPYKTSRYSLVSAIPLTGRRHQIRLHFKHISHQLIGDTMYGDGRHNAFFRERFGLNRLFLHCSSLELTHPATARDLNITAPLPVELGLVLDGLGYVKG